ncbi:response regulator transcription factor [Puteibacter caeruleilacunae]|nr:response regulator transcription factor [Puteibacter caeruleilacunae]
MKNKIKVLLVDDQKIMRVGLMHILKSDKSIEICGEAESGVQLFRLLESIEPDVIIVDVYLPDMNGIEIAERLSEQYSHIPFFMLTVYADEKTFIFCTQNGSRGFLSKNCSPAELLNAVHDVAKGGHYFGARTSALIQRIFQHLDISKRGDNNKQSVFDALEIELIKMISKGIDHRSISKRLCLTMDEIAQFRFNILKKLRINCTLDFVKYVLKHRIVTI